MPASISAHGKKSDREMKKFSPLVLMRDFLPCRERDGLRDRACRMIAGSRAWLREYGPELQGVGGAGPAETRSRETLLGAPARHRREVREA